MDLASRSRKRLSLVLTVLGPVFWLATAVTAAADDPREPTGQDGRTLKLRLVLPDGEVVRATAVLDDRVADRCGTITVEHPEVGKLKFVPAFGTDGHEINLQVIQVQEAAAGEVATLGQIVPLEEGIARPTVVNGRRIEVMALRIDGSSPSSPPAPTNGLILVGECCITCGNITACGCAVEMDCGQCCGIDICCTAT